ncbi:UDP-glucose 4-epimerase GalE [Marinomonas mediterranea]|jgi:UDP-galactose 4-epimerase (EC 5.1.3.2)|uniref:UDP-glucose 4-epimerase n=1 Tax=Marinomonas mediterranea (strain ATCC 700492 / JCM 21426 / NBRC 103028 / MMB-1) TaxID=717774 RepID=F2K182_MARM1|nr:UDP-glucose 4-epimerase GalE [Marinomonas mediterranea]ADZ89932.1 UDP-glucose 4-epimerase [Marinomonas mediterranea MMB-1]WCN12107.1 UDP-glucose 4-epimerase GalE [Marinomonas mediterranea]WCN16144.1 UDP-glucose 4-epimerase GalE [Marinomonas mediterranea MMB-1]
MQTVLVTGGAGFIGSHTCVELLERGFDVIVVDNLINSSKVSLERIKQITGKTVTFYPYNLLSKVEIAQVFAQHAIDSVIHFAGLKAVGESTKTPIAYYNNNLTGTLTLLECMQNAGVFNFVFSSSATVYGENNPSPYAEHFPLSSTSPYGRTKVMIEQFLQDIFNADPRWNISLLRYFNPVGAHPSGLIGEDPNGIPNNLMPFIAQVAVGKRQKLSIFGGDYPTQDGTGVRDYIHVVDLAIGHIKALEKLNLQTPHSIEAYNLGAGKGYSVLDVVKAFEKASNQTIAYEIAPRRAGDIAEFYADTNKAKDKLDWSVELDLNAMCRDSWNWQSHNPNGYST